MMDLCLSTRGTGAISQAAHIHSLQQEVTALVECLFEANLLQEQKYLARLHRLRFASACAASPLQELVGVKGMLTSNGIQHCAQLIVRMAGTKAGASFRCVSLAVVRQLPLTVYLCGGHGGQEGVITPTDAVENFNVQKGEWSALAPMWCRRVAPAVATCSGFIYICGGSDGEQILNSAERFEPFGGQWEQLPAMSTRRWHAAAYPISGAICVCGGEDSASTPLASAEGFDGAAGAWKRMPRMAAKRCYPSLVMFENELVVCGGLDGEKLLKAVECFDPSAGAWAPLPSLHAGRMKATATSLFGRLYVCGGHCPEEMPGALESFDPNAGAWEVVRSPVGEIPRGSCSQAVVAAGRLYVFSCQSLADDARDRHDEPVLVTSSAEASCNDKIESTLQGWRYDPITGSWMVVPGPPLGRLSTLASVGSLVYSCGGSESTGSPSAVVSQLNATGCDITWQIMPRLAAPRWGASAVTLWL